jgi:hypothetical protein
VGFSAGQWPDLSSFFFFFFLIHRKSRRRWAVGDGVWAVVLIWLLDWIFCSHFKFVHFS